MKPIKEYVGLYSAERNGLVYSHSREWRTGTGRAMLMIKKGSYLHPRISSKGYQVGSLCKNAVCKSFNLHRLIAQAFIPNPKNLPQVNHKNGVKTDNRVENLEWCTNLQNRRHAIDNGIINFKGSLHHLSKLTEKDVLSIRETYRKSRISQQKIASKYGVSRECISRIARRDTWKHI